MAEPRKVFRIEQTAAARLARRVDAAPGSDLTRIAHELDAVTGGATQATQKILAAAEQIDQLADNLSAALQGRIEQDLAQDISDLVIRIFEACNFHDLIAQRVDKVMKTLNSDAPAPDEATPQLYGPRLVHDDGHMTQAEIDALFGS